MDLSVHQSGAAATPPIPPASPSIGYPTPGNPGTGLAASIPGAYWRYQLQAEMAAVIAAAGLTPNHASLTQVRDAIRALADAEIVYQFGATDTTPDKCHLNENGWQILPSGLIIQWGSVSIYTTGAPGTWLTWAATLPIAFPTAGLIGFATPGVYESGIDSLENIINVQSVSTTAINGGAMRAIGDWKQGEGKLNINYIALGH